MDVLGFYDMNFEVKGQNEELWSWTFEQRIRHFQKYPHNDQSFKRVPSFYFDLYSQGLPQRSILALEIKGCLTKKSAFDKQNLTCV